jgi:hypothetical protein
VIDKGCGVVTIVSDSGFSTDWFGVDSSSSLKMSAVVPTAVGTPVIAPVVGSSERPAGMAGEPAARLHV